MNTSSVWGTYPGPAHVAYCTSKGAVAALTKNLGRDCAPLGIRVNAVCPHEINTPMIRSGFERRGLDPDKAVEELNKTVPWVELPSRKTLPMSSLFWPRTKLATLPEKPLKSPAPNRFPDKRNAT
ncbi:SDR family oxidoreductase [Aliamphritea spongicola]|nr:SDR family oxidoreductase [Aliamphritea spongicola]